ncbi:putative cDENN domain-containing protein [Plasmopara halstedii]
MQRVLHKKKKNEPKTVQDTSSDHALSPLLPTSQSNTTSIRRHPTTLYHSKSTQNTPQLSHDQVVVGLSASIEDEVEDWSSDFISTERHSRWKRHENLEIGSSENQVKRLSSSSSNGMIGQSRRGSEVGGSSSSSGHADEDETRNVLKSHSSSHFHHEHNEYQHSDSDEDWDLEFGFDDEADSTLGSLKNSMDPTRRRAENGNFFLPNLHDVLDGEMFLDDDELDDGMGLNFDTSTRQQRRLSDEPLFQKRKNELHQSPASADGSSDGIRSSITSISATSSSSVEYTLVDKLRLLDVANSSAYAVRIERYPKPSTTFSQLERDRLHFPTLSENRYEQWLMDLIVPQCTIVSRHMELEQKRLPPPRQLKNQQFYALVSLPFGREFVDMFFKQICYYRYFGEEKENRELLRMYFEKVSTTGMTDEQWAEKILPLDLDYVVGCSIEILQEAARLYGPKPDTPLATHLSLSMLSSASSASSSQGNKTTIYWIQQFQDILVHCAEAFPKASNVVALLELRYVCHHLAGFASGEYQYKWQICNQLPSFRPLEPVIGDSASQIVTEVLQYYGALFQHLNTSPDSRSHRYTGHNSSSEKLSFQTDNEIRQYALTSDVICLQALVLCDIQSLYDSKSALAEISLPALEELLEFEDDEATVDPSLVGLLPCCRDSRSSSSSSTTDPRDGGYERFDSSKGLGGWSANSKLFELLRPSCRTRTSALTFFYERIAAAKFPLIKAKCALVLATMHVCNASHGNLRVAETLAYEAVRLLDVCSKQLMVQISITSSRRSRDKSLSVSCLSVFNNDGLLSDLGREALECLGNILIKNNKYRYGILCLEAAGTLFSFLNQGSEYEKLDRLLCKLTLEADDVHRALPLHEKVTYAAQRQGNITVYVYLTQEMTKLWIQEGNFTRAEEYLATACHFLRDHTNLLPPHFLSSAISASYSSSEAHSTRSGTMMTATSSSVSSSLSGSFYLSSRSTGNANEVDTWLNHDINLHLLVRDVYRSSGRCLEGMRVVEHLLNYSARLPRGKRTQLRMLLAEDALKMRMFDTCRHMFSLMEREATAFCDRLQENIKGFTTGPGSSSGTGPGTSSSGGGRSLGGMGSEARYCFDMSFTLRYIVCRVKMYIKLRDFRNAYAWLSLAHVKNDRDNVRKQAQLHVLDGKVLRALVQEEQERGSESRRDTDARAKRGRTSSSFVGTVVSPSQIEEMLKPLGVSLYGLNQDEKSRLNERMHHFVACVRDVRKAEEQALDAFWTAFDQYRLLDDSLFQLKVLLEIVSFILSPIQRSFLALGSNQDDEMLKSHLQRRSSDKETISALEVRDLGGDDTVEKTRKTLLEAQKLLRSALVLAEQVAYPACFLQTLIYCSEVWVWLERIASYKSEKHLKEATAFWEEAVRVMKGVFFRRVAFHDIADAQMLHSSGFNTDFAMPNARGLNKGRFCVVPILNFSEGFIVKLEAMTLQLILAACQLQQFERVPEYVEETLLTHLDELLSARMCLSSIVHQLQTFRANQKSHKRLPPSGSASNLAAAIAALPSGSSLSISSAGSSNSRSSSFSSVIPIPSPQRSASGRQIPSTPSPRSAGVAGGKRASHKKNQSMSSISEMLTSNAPSPYHDGAGLYGFKSSATPRTGLASLSERPNVPTSSGKVGAAVQSGHTFKKNSERKSRRYTRERSRSAPQPEVPAYSSPRVDLLSSRTGDGHEYQEKSILVATESEEKTDFSLKSTSSVKIIDLSDLQTLPSGEEFLLERSDAFRRDEGSSSNGAIGLCDFDEVQSEKLWWIFNLWRNAKSKYVEGKIETSAFRSSNLRYLRTLLDAFDPQQIAVLYFGGADNMSTDSVVTPGGTRVVSEGNSGNPNGMLDFDVSRINSHALIQDRQLVLSIGYEYSREMRTTFGTHPKLQFKVFRVQEGDTKAWRQEIPRPDWYLSEYDILEAEDAAVGTGVLRTMRLLGAKLLVKLVGVLLMDCSVVVVGNSYPQIQEMTTSLLKLLEPFRWQHTFLPFVPVTSWRFLYDAMYHHAQAELATRPKSRRSFSRLSHDWRAWSTGSGSSAGGSSYSSSRGSNESLPSGTLMSNEIVEEEPPFLLGATADTWQKCCTFSRKCGNDPRLLSSGVVVVNLDDVDALATDKMLRNAVPLPKKWRRQFLDRIEKLTRQRHKMRLKMATTPTSASNVTFIRSPPVTDGAFRSYDDALNTSRSGNSWIMSVSTSESDNHHHIQSGVHSSVVSELDDRKHYDSECAAAFVSGLRDFYDKLLTLCTDKAKVSKKKKKSLSTSGHSKRQEIKSWFSSSHDFDAFVDHFLNSDLLEAFEKEKAAAKEEIHRGLNHLERRSSEYEVSLTSSGRSSRALVSSFTPQLKSFGSLSSLSTSNRTSGGGQEGKR